MVTKFHDGDHLSTTFASAKRLLNDLQRLLLNHHPLASAGQARTIAIA
jgi:hypothetical protein